MPTVLHITRGDTEHLDFSIDGLTATQAQEAEFALTAKPDHQQAEPTLTKTTADDGITVDTTNPNDIRGTATLHPQDTQDLPPKTTRLVYDLQATLQDGTVITIDRGVLVIHPDVTA